MNKLSEVALKITYTVGCTKSWRYRTPWNYANITCNWIRIACHPRCPAGCPTLEDSIVEQIDSLMRECTRALEHKLQGMTTLSIVSFNWPNFSFSMKELEVAILCKSRPRGCNLTGTNKKEQERFWVTFWENRNKRRKGTMSWFFCTWGNNWTIYGKGAGEERLEIRYGFEMVGFLRPSCCERWIGVESSREIDEEPQVRHL